VNQSITSDDEYEDDNMPLDVANFMHYQFSTTPEEHHDMNSSTAALYGKSYYYLQYATVLQLYMLDLYCKLLRSGAITYITVLYSCTCCKHACVLAVCNR
jgi:hypothetical protein